MRFDLIEDFARKNSWPEYRLTQISGYIFKKSISSWDEAVSLPADLRTELKKNFGILSFSAQQTLRSKDLRAKKALLKLEKDGLNIETALIRPMPDKWCACLSTQAGCPIKCPFCATGRSGFARNLSAEEICDQALFWNQVITKENIAKRLSSIVYMGMGEPFFNYGALSKSIKLLSSPDLFGLGQRHISVSTAGHMPGILQLAKDFPQVNLAVSLHSADDRLRDKLVPINRTFGLKNLRHCLNDYIKITNRRVFIEYALMSEVNDSKKDAEVLAEWIKSLNDGKLLHVNLLQCNETSGFYKPSSDDKMKTFSNMLKRVKIPVTIRKSLGSDIKAACGQLRNHPQ